MCRKIKENCLLTRTCSEAKDWDVQNSKDLSKPLQPEVHDRTDGNQSAVTESWRYNMTPGTGFIAAAVELLQQTNA